MKELNMIPMGRVLLVVACVSASLIGGMILNGAQDVKPEKKVIQAERFELVDASGRIRALFETDRDGSPGIQLFDKSGQARAKVALDKNGEPEIVPTDKGGRTPAPAKASGIPDVVQAHSIQLVDKDGQLYGSWDIIQGYSVLTLVDPKTKARAKLSMFGEGSSELAFISPKAEMAGKIRFAGGRLDMVFDEGGQQKAQSVVMTSSGSDIHGQRFILYDPKSSNGFIQLRFKEGSGLDVLDSKGKSVGHVP